MGRRPWLVGCAGLALVVLLVWVLLFASSQNRIEREHSIELPESARDMQAMGDASNPLLLLIGIDRGASSIVVIDRADLDELLGQFALSRDPAFSGGQPAPANNQYQPSTVPWAGGPDSTPEDSFYSADPPGSGDFANLSVFTIDESTVAVWIYTDWN